ncbi:MAG: hypothetical protein RQ761_11855 [Bacteroidales bacterium]|nr:hypothetical protein [Bacteroidales bacterium]
MKRLQFYFKQLRILDYFNLLLGVIIAGIYTNALIYPNMGVDASYYLRVTECLADGAIPEYDLRILYSPLVFYMLLPLKLLVGKAIAYELFLGYMFLIQVLNAILLYQVAGKYATNRFIRIFAALLYLFLSMKLEGEYFILEPFVNFWGLLAIWVYLRMEQHRVWALLLSGSFTFMAFMSKQYGLAYAGIIFLMILIDGHASFKKWFGRGLLFAAGMLGGLLLFMLLFQLAYGVPYDFFAGGRLGLYGEKDGMVMLQGMLKYLAIAPYLMLLLIPPVSKKLFKTQPHVMAYLFLLLLFSVQLYFQQYAHYYILLLPGLLLTGVVMAALYMEKKKGWVLLMLLASLLMNEFSISPRTRSLLLSKRSGLKADIELAQKINTIIPAGARVYLFNNVKLYYLCHFSPAVPEKYGFAFNNALSYDDLVDILNHAEYVLVEDTWLYLDYPILDRHIIITEESAMQSYEYWRQVEGYNIFRHSSLPAQNNYSE